MPEFKWKGGIINQKMHQAIGEAMDSQGSRLVWRIRRVLNTPYPPASTPGNPPHKRTGTLRKSVYHEVNRRRLSLRIKIDKVAFYWIFLEYGTRNMEARPFLGVTFDAMRPTIGLELARLVRRLLRGGSAPKKQTGKGKPTRSKASKSKGNPKKASKRKTSKKKPSKTIQNAKKSLKKFKTKASKAVKRAQRTTKKLARKATKKAKKAAKRSLKSIKKGLKKTIKSTKKTLKKRAAIRKKSSAQKKRASKKRASVRKKQIKAIKKTAKKFGKAFKKGLKSKPKIDPKKLSGSDLTRWLLRESRKFLGESFKE